jgi:acyl-coenzyme A synthetase/AMP-(fatty) acid ligase
MTDTPHRPPSPRRPLGPADGRWVDDVLLTGPDSEVCLRIGAPVTRAALRDAVTGRQDVLRAAGLRPGGTVALRLPPSVGFVVELLAAWRAGAQVTLIDHRLTDYEATAALERVGAQFVVEPAAPLVGALRGFQLVEPVVTARPTGAPAATAHALIQLSSGSTGPSKVIGRTAEDLLAELGRYAKLDGIARSGERIVLLASMVHVLGLVGGLLHSLHAGVTLSVPERMTIDGILGAVAAQPEPTTLLGVPFHTGLLTAVAAPPPLPQLVRMTTGGELVRPGLPERFAELYGATLGNMYGMTEVGVIATDLAGEHRPALVPAPGIEVRAVDGELQIRREASPYVGLADPTRWSDGWLRTRDAGRVDCTTGRLTVLGRRDSQITLGGLQVDLTEVEQAVVALAGVTEAVVGFDGAITAYAVLAEGTTTEELDAALATRLAAYKRPTRWRVVDALPRTTTGKLSRDPAALTATAGR